MLDANSRRRARDPARRWIATQSLADPTRIGCEIARRPASALRTTTTTLNFASTI
jgi:hypothetical protein